MDHSNHNNHIMHNNTAGGMDMNVSYFFYSFIKHYEDTVLWIYVRNLDYDLP